MARFRIGGTRGAFITFKGGHSKRSSESVFPLVLLAVIVILLAWGKMGIEAKVFTVLFSSLVIFGYFFLERRKKQIRMRRLRALRLSNIDSMSGLQFEQYIAEILRHKGYKRVTVTKGSGDFGVDILAEKDGVKYAIQVKRHSKPVSRRAISDAIGGLKHYQCQAAMVVTNNYFTRDAITLAKSNACQLIDRDLLGIWIVEFQSREHK